MSKKSYWRFHAYKFNDDYFLYDCFSLKLFSISEDLFLLINKRNTNKIKRKFPEFYNKIINGKQIKLDNHDENICNVTINFSNYCNLDCEYCYRNKKNKNHMEHESIRDILSFILNEYMPNALGYVFSLCYTSESALDLDYLKYFDSLIAEFEGHLFESCDLLNKEAKVIFENFPSEIKKRYEYEFDNGTDYITLLNDVLKKEKLWLYSDKINDYFKSILEYTDDVSLSYRVKINRDIINNTYPEFNLNKNRPFIVMSFITNGTVINDEFISFVRSINMRKIGVSIDGNAEIHNRSRYFIGKKNSYDNVVQGINKLISNGIQVSANVVLQPFAPFPYEIYKSLHSLGVDDQVFTLLRSKNDLRDQHFTEKTLNLLLNDYDKLMNTIKNEILKNNFKIVYELRNMIIFVNIKFLYFKNFKNRRCSWGENLVIAADCNVYHCNYSIDNPMDNQGHYRNITKNSIKTKSLTVDDLRLCRKCWAKYLCGGVCYYEKLKKNNEAINIECKYKKVMIQKSLELFSWIKNNNCLERVIEELKKN